MRPAAKAPIAGLATEAAPVYLAGVAEAEDALDEAATVVVPATGVELAALLEAAGVVATDAAELAHEAGADAAELTDDLADEAGTDATELAAELADDLADEAGTVLVENELDEGTTALVAGTDEAEDDQAPQV